MFLALGAGAVVNGRLRRGFHNAAGEVGDIVLARSYLGHHRHRHGAREKVIGGPAIRRAAKRATGKDLSAAQAPRKAERDERLGPIAKKVADYVAMTLVAVGALLDPVATIRWVAPRRPATGSSARCATDSRPNSTSPRRSSPPFSADAKVHGAVSGVVWVLDPELAPREVLR